MADDFGFIYNGVDLFQLDGATTRGLRKWQHDKSASTPSIMKGRRQPTNRSRFYARITSARTSFRSYANGAMALGKMRKPGDQSKLR